MSFIDFHLDFYDEVLINFSNLDQFLFVVESEFNISELRKVLFEKRGLVDVEILTRDEFKERVFFREKPILKGYNRVIAFYNSLDKKHREQFHIRNIFDCMDFSERFFKLYEELAEERKIKEERLFDWQKDIFKYLEEIKSNYKSYVIKEDLEDKIFVYHPARIDIKSIQSRKVVALNLISLSRLDRYIFEAFKDSEMFLHLSKGDYDTVKFNIKSLTIPKNVPKISIKELEDNFTQAANIVYDINNLKGAKIINTKSDKYLFDMKHIILQEPLFEESQIYVFLSALLEILESIDRVSGQMSVDISTLLKFQSCEFFSKYYKFSTEEKNSLVSLAKSGYKYIPKGFGLFKELFNDIDSILLIQNFEAFNKYMVTKELDEFFKDAELHELFYSALLEMSALNISLNKKWKSLFHKGEAAVSFLKFFLRSLQKRRVKLSTRNKRYSSLSLQQLETSENLVILNLDEKSFKRSGSNFFLNDEQRKHLHLKNADILNLEHKYRYFRAIFAAKNVFLYYIKNEDTEAASLLEELILRKSAIVKPSIIQDAYINASKVFFGANDFQQLENDEDDVMPLSKKELLDGDEFSIGFYDFNEINKCQYKYYLKAIAKLPNTRLNVVSRIDPNLLGNIIHDLLDVIGSKMVERVKKSDYAVDEHDIKLELERIIKNEEFKIPKHYQQFYEKILYPFIVKSTISFYKGLELRFKNEKVTAFLLEDPLKREITRIDKVNVVGKVRRNVNDVNNIDKTSERDASLNHIRYLVKGKADLRIETEDWKYIFDYKTGHADPKQLDFYELLYYPKDKYVIKFFYKIFEENIKEEAGYLMEERDLQEDVFSLLYQDFYRRAENKVNCKNCEYLDICKVRGK